MKKSFLIPRGCRQGTREDMAAICHLVYTFTYTTISLLFLMNIVPPFYFTTEDSGYQRSSFINSYFNTILLPLYRGFPPYADFGT